MHVIQICFWSIASIECLIVAYKTFGSHVDGRLDIYTKFEIEPCLFIRLALA